jgi:hypothetical protein
MRTESPLKWSLMRRADGLFNACQSTPFIAFLAGGLASSAAMAVTRASGSSLPKRLVTERSMAKCNLDLRLRIG